MSTAGTLATLNVVGRQRTLKAERRAERHERGEARRLARERGAQDGARRGCLICRRSDGGFATEEHIVPESLGNREKILPYGVVCDRCNHEVCAPLDEALCSFMPIQMLRTMRQQPTKGGKLPSANFDNGKLESAGPGALSIALAGAKWHKNLPSAPGTRSFSFTAQSANAITGDRASRVHRALVKQALEFMWLDYGDQAFSAKFDRERSIVLDGGHHGYVATLKKLQFPTGVRLDHGMQLDRVLRTSDGHPLIRFVASYWGVPFASDTLFPEPTGDDLEALLIWKF